MRAVVEGAMIGFPIPMRGNEVIDSVSVLAP